MVATNQYDKFLWPSLNSTFSDKQGVNKSIKGKGCSKYSELGSNQKLSTCMNILKVSKKLYR